MNLLTQLDQRGRDASVKDGGVALNLFLSQFVLEVIGAEGQFLPRDAATAQQFERLFLPSPVAAVILRVRRKLLIKVSLILHPSSSGVCCCPFSACPFGLSLQPVCPACLSSLSVQLVLSACEYVASNERLPPARSILHFACNFSHSSLVSGVVI